MSGETAKWIIVGIAAAGMAFNTGVLWNDVKHLKKSVDKIRTVIDKIKCNLRYRKEE